MSDKIDLLINTLLDNAAREDERHDAALNIGHYDDDRAIMALTKIASNPLEDNIVLDACGESLAKILVTRNKFQGDLIEQLTFLTKRTAIAFIEHNKPEWIEKYGLDKQPFID